MGQNFCSDVNKSYTKDVVINLTGHPVYFINDNILTISY